ncbi:MAG TPA: YfcE family phosphodiesterase [Patescibacteria group bacterium]
MLIAIISDVHDNIPNLKKVLDYCNANRIEKIICCGDLASQETLDYLCDNFPGEIFFAFGNMDSEHENHFHITDGEYRNAHIFSKHGEMEIKSKKIAFVHYPDSAKKLCESGKYSFVFHGHTHKPWTEVLGNCTLLNPGNVANQIYQPTFAVWNTSDNKFQLIRINNLP